MQLKKSVMHFSVAENTKIGFLATVLTLEQNKVSHWVQRKKWMLLDMLEPYIQIKFEKACTLCNDSDGSRVS